MKLIECELCGEHSDPEAGNGMAEMFDPNDWSLDSVICHVDCGLAKGMEMA